MSVIFRQKNIHQLKKPVLAKVFSIKGSMFLCWWRTKLMLRSQGKLLNLANELLINSFCVLLNISTWILSSILIIIFILHFRDWKMLVGKHFIHCLKMSKCVCKFVHIEGTEFWVISFIWVAHCRARHNCLPKANLICPCLALKVNESW